MFFSYGCRRRSVVGIHRWNAVGTDGLFERRWPFRVTGSFSFYFAGLMVQVLVLNTGWDYNSETVCRVFVWIGSRIFSSSQNDCDGCALF